MIAVKTNNDLVKKTVSFYQSATYLFKNGLLRDTSQQAPHADK